jgi:AAA+ superfamily predicted ATPase
MGTSQEDLLETIKHAPISDLERKSLLDAVANGGRLHNAFFFEGEHGTGKTYIAENLIRALNRETIVFSCKQHSFNNQKEANSFEDVLQNIKPNEEQVIFIDNINILMDKAEMVYTQKDRKNLLKIIEAVNMDHKKVLIITGKPNNQIEELTNRASLTVEFRLPDCGEKGAFLLKKFKNLSPETVQHIAGNTIGYTYTDIINMLKIADTIGDGAINNKAVESAIKKYVPNSLKFFDVKTDSAVRMADVVGRKLILERLSKIIATFKNNELSKRLCIKRNNLLLFCGPPGTGKTFMVKAIAGETGFPILNLKADIIECNPYYSIDQIVKMAKIHKNCILFVDEAEKLFGKESLQEDNVMLGEFNQLIDGADGKEIQSILILSVNDIARLGRTLRDRFTEIRFGLPENEEREEFFRRRMEKIAFPASIDPQVIVRNTQNMSFRDIEKLWDELMFRYIENPLSLNEDAVKSIASEYNTAPVNQMCG